MSHNNSCDISCETGKCSVDVQSSTEFSLPIKSNLKCIKLTLAVKFCLVSTPCFGNNKKLSENSDPKILY